MVALGIIFLIVPFLIGIDDNFPGILLLFLGIIILIIAFVHHWRERKKFKFLLIFSLHGIPVFVVMHNLLDGLNKITENSTILSNILDFLSGLSFLLALIICPMGLLIGANGLGLVRKNKSN
jgi:hypothetical protein